jgi:hypothetical protein
VSDNPVCRCFNEMWLEPCPVHGEFDGDPESDDNGDAELPESRYR